MDPSGSSFLTLGGAQTAVQKTEGPKGALGVNGSRCRGNCLPLRLRGPVALQRQSVVDLSQGDFVVPWLSLVDLPR